MSERYSKLFILPENMYAIASPVLVVAGTLLKDNQSNKVLAQLKLRNIGKKTIKAATVCLNQFDTVGNLLGQPIIYQYLDLQVNRDADFGQKVPVALPNPTTRSFTVSVVQVIFSDNTIWNSDSQMWEPLNKPDSLDVMDDTELAKQFRIEYGSECKNLLLEQKDLWHCVCGAVNHQEERKCHKCKKILLDLQNVNMADLQKREIERVSREQEEVKQAKATAKKTTKIAIVVISILIVAILAIIVIAGMIEKENAYNNALTALENGQYEEAASAFAELSSYKDSAELLQYAKQEEQYHKAISYYQAGDYENAINAFDVLGSYKDSLERIIDIKNTWYNVAVDFAENGNISDAISAFWKLGDFQDAEEYSKNLLISITDWQVISAGTEHTVGLKTDGSVVATGNNSSGQCDVSDWIDIVAVSAGDSHTVGLKSDGTVVATGDNKYGACDVSDWTDIVAISAGDDSTVALKSDGSVVAAGIGQYEVTKWSGIIAISASIGGHTVGLKTDGSVVATGNNSSGQCDVSDWADIVAVAAGYRHTVGLKSDGTVVAVGGHSSIYGSPCDVSSWKNVVAISTGYNFTFGLTQNKTVKCETSNSGRWNCSSWENITAISAGSDYSPQFIVAVKSDGTVITAGDNTYGQCNVSNWTDIKQPE